jgi:hypothetical protein
VHSPPAGNMRTLSATLNPPHEPVITTPPLGLIPKREAKLAFVVNFDSDGCLQDAVRLN